jgi:hypothetical protein
MAYVYKDPIASPLINLFAILAQHNQRGRKMVRHKTKSAPPLKRFDLHGLD